MSLERYRFGLDALEATAALLRNYLPSTPQYAWPLLAERCGAEVWVKHENHLPTGAFKVRGGITYLEALKRRQPLVPGIVSATRGNHGQSLAYAGRAHGVPVTIVMPHGNSREKNAAMRAQGATLVEHGEDFEAAKAEAARLAASGLHFVPSFHPDLVRGVATYSLEFLRAVPELDALYVPIGLGSGICGAIAARRALGLRTEIVGVQAAGADPYARSIAAGERVVLPRSDTRADGMAVREPDADALAIIRNGVARVVTVSDAQIAEAIAALWTDTHNLAEGAGAAGLAALLSERERMRGLRVGIVLCGGNIDLALFRSWVLEAPAA
ncbi:MAG TPA: threonine dehydratase [Acidisphaera sp.]|nr:threonine dehydratase [Acidisphaera sp.]